MATDSTPDELLAEYKAAMGDRLGAVFYALYNDLVWLNTRWNEFRALYAAGPETIALLNRHGPFFFKMVQDTLWEHTLLTIARMTDPARTKGNENLSLPHMVELIEDASFRKEAEVLLEQCMTASAFAREHRNKRLAHRDLMHAIKEAPVPLSGVSRAHMEAALEAFGQLMNHMLKHYRNSTSILKMLGSNGARSLILDLQDLERRRKSDE